MWKLAKTSAQKLAIIRQQVPISSRDWNQAIIAFSGDTDFSLAEEAQKELKNISPKQLGTFINRDITYESAKAILFYASEIGVSALIIKLVELRKITDTDFIAATTKQPDRFWNPLITHGDFVSLMAREQEKTLELLAFSPTLQHTFVEQLNYLSDEKIELYHRDIALLKPVEISPEETFSFDGDEDDDIIIITDDEDEVITFDDEFSDLETNSEDSDILSLDDVPDFFMDDSTFANLTMEEQSEKREKIQITLSKLNIGEKTKVAMKGNLEIRKILIKDPIKLIAKAVLNNSGITAKEIALISSNAATSIDLISFIANTKSLNKYYQVKMALITNPKLPVRLGMRLLELIRMSDLKKIAKSRGVSQVIRQRALRKIK